MTLLASSICPVRYFRICVEEEGVGGRLNTIGCVILIPLVHTANLSTQCSSRLLKYADIFILNLREEGGMYTKELSGVKLKNIYHSFVEQTAPPPPSSSGGWTGSALSAVYCRQSGERLGECFPWKTKGWPVRS